MAYIIETPNPFEPLKSSKEVLNERISIRELVRRKHPSGEFPIPTVCVVNGEPRMRATWDAPIEAGDVVNFIAVPAGIETIIVIAITVVALSVSLAMMLNQPKVPGEQPASDPVFSTKGQSNAIRLGEPIECCYGRNRIYPSYASRPYFEYRNNDQFQFSLFCLGQGKYDIESIKIGDTDIDNYAEVQYEVYEPGEEVTLFPTAVYTASEAGGQTVYAPNAPEYVDPGWVGPFTANPSGTTAHTLQVDIVLPKGLYRQKKSGGLDTAGVTFEIQYREIDNAGAPVGSWLDFLGGEQTLTGATTTPQRRTFMSPVTSGRYEVRMRRTSPAGLTSNFGDELVWDGLRTYLEEEQNFGDVTLLAVIIRATNNLNNQTQQEFNVIATRKLPMRESGGTWSEPIATRSIVWAVVDLFRSNYGGRIVDDDFFDWDVLEELDITYTLRDEHFDWVFRDPITVWEAARAVARVGRATPLLAGSLLTLKRDGPLSVPVTLFNQENILSQTFEWEIKLWDADEYDSIAVEYTEPSTGYKQEVVVATLPGGTTDHPEDVRFPGIQDRNHAYREALYMLAVRRYIRQNVTFDTGLEGMIPTYGDLVAVVHDTPNWGQGGYVVNAQLTGPSQYTLWLSEPLRWTTGEEHQISLRQGNGSILGPFTALQTTDDKQVVIDVVESVEEIDFLLTGNTEPMLFMFGLADQQTAFLKVVMVEPQGKEAVRLTAAIENSIVHSFDELEAPALNTSSYAPTPPDLPTIQDLTLTQIDSGLYIMQASWSAAFGAQYYIVQTSEDGVFWRERLTTTRTSIQFQALPGPLYVRVAGVNKGQGPWKTETFNVDFLLALTLTTPFEDFEWEISWSEVPHATGYLVRVYDDSESSPVQVHEETITNRSFHYEYADAVSDGLSTRYHKVGVTPVFPPDDVADDDPEEVTLEITNPLPEPPANVGSEVDSVGSAEVVYRLFWDAPTEPDVIRIKVWVSDTPGFDPSVDVPVLDEEVSASSSFPTEYLVSVSLDPDFTHDAKYWRVGFFDVWGNEISTNISEEQEVYAWPVSEDLFSWLRMEALSGLSDTDLIDPWPDSSAASHDYVRRGGYTGVLYRDSVPGIPPCALFASGSSMLCTPSAGESLLGYISKPMTNHAMTVIVLYASSVGTPSDFSSIVSSNDTTRSCIGPSLGTHRMVVGNYGTTGETEVVEDFVLMSVAATGQYPSGSSVLRINGNVIDQTTVDLLVFPFGTAAGPMSFAGASPNKPEAILGANALTFGLDGYVLEVLIYDRALSTAEMVSVEAYLQAKHGLP